MTTYLPCDNPFQIELIQSIKNASTSEDVVRLEKIMKSYLNQLQTTYHHRQHGWSDDLGRWHPDESLKKLQNYYYKTLLYSNNVKHIIDKKREKIQRKCAHEWQYDPTDRDERTHYICIHCKKWR